jgi:hypothetical protein
MNSMKDDAKGMFTGGGDDDGEGMASKLGIEMDDETMDKGKQMAAQIAENWAEMKASMMAKLKIIISWGQIASSFGGTFEIPWPASFKGMLGGMGLVANIDVMQLFNGMKCNLDTSFVRTYWTHMFSLPALLFIIGVAAIVAALPLMLNKKRKYTLTDLKSRIIASLAFVTFLLYPGLANRIVTVYKCRLIGGVDYLVADYSVVCWEGAHAKMVAANYFFIAAYIIGMPLIMFLSMYANRKTIKSDPKNVHMLSMYGSMYKAYEPDYWFFEIIEMMRKLVLTAGLVLVSPGSTAQIFLGILVCFFYCCATMNMKPLLDESDDHLSQAASVQLFMTLLTGLVLKVDVSSEGRYEQMVVGGLLIFMNVAIIAMGLGVLGKTFVDAQMENLQAQKKKALMVANVAKAAKTKLTKPSEEGGEDEQSNMPTEKALTVGMMYNEMNDMDTDKPSEEGGEDEQSNVPTIADAPALTDEQSNVPTIADAPALTDEQSNVPTIVDAPALTDEQSNVPTIADDLTQREADPLNSLSAQHAQVPNDHVLSLIQAKRSVD